MKRLFSIVLVLLMLVSVMPTGIVSAEEIELIDINTLEVKLLSEESEYNGQAFLPQVSVTNGENALIKDEDYSLSYSDEQSVNVGEYIVTVEGMGLYTGQKELAYSITPALLTQIKECFTISQDTYSYTGEEIKPQVLFNGEAVNEDEFTVAYDQDTINLGVKQISVTANENTNYQGEIVLEYEIVKISLEDIKDNFSLSANQGEYNGEEHTVDVLYNGESLPEHFEVVKPDSIVNADKYVFTVTAKEQSYYQGQVELEYQVAPKDISALWTLKQVDEQALVYNGEYQTPEVKVFDAEVEVLADNYDVKYENNLNAGQLTVTIEAKGNFCGSVSVNIEILPKSLEGAIINPITDVVFTGEEITPDVAVNVENIQLQKDIDYIVEYKDNFNAGSATVTITGKDNYCGSAQTEFNILPKQIDSLEIVGEYTYTAHEIVPQIVVKAEQTELTEQDYDVEIIDNLNAGSATVTVTAKGNYSGELTENFEIAKMNISDFDFRLTQYSFTYDQKPHCPDVDEYLYNDVPLVLGTDYTVTKDKTTANVGSYQIVINAMGNFEGSKTLVYTINEASLENLADLFELVQDGQKVTDSTYVYDSQEHIPEILFNGVDVNTFGCFRVEYNKDKDYYKTAGEKIITVYGESPYSKSVELKYVINQYDINDYLTDNALQVEYSYNGLSIEDGIVYTSNEIKPDAIIPNLVSDVEYEVLYQNNTNAGKAVIVLKGKGNYCGIIQKEFDILPLEITTDNSYVITNFDKATYTGYEIKPLIMYITVNGIELKGEDYVLTFSNNINITTNEKAKMVLSGVGNYVGQLEFEYEITPLAFKSINPSIIKVEKLDSYLFDGKAKTPSVTIEGTVDGTKYKLVEGQDFTVNYWNNVDVGASQIMIRGMGNTTGMYITSFRIEPVTIKEDNVVIDDSKCVYTGGKITPKVKVKINKKTLSSSNYSVTLLDNVKAGQATIAIVGKGNYDGVVLKHFNIAKRKLSASMFKTSSSVAYTGKALKPTVSYTNCTSSDFSVSYSNNVNYGTATVTIKGKSNCTGSTKITFKIVPKKVSGVDAKSVAYNSAKISWNTISGVTGYEVFRSSSQNGTYTRIARVKKSTTTSYTDKTLTAGLTYYYKVRAIKSVSGSYYNGFASSAASVRAVPNKVTISSLRNTKSKTASLVWNKQSGMTGYQVYASTRKSSGYKKVATVKGANNVSFDHNPLTKGKTYYYKVRAYKVVDGEYVYGAFSSYKYIKISK